MRATDRYGLPVSSSSEVAVERYRTGVDDLFAYSFGADERFAEAVDADPSFALPHAAGALLALFQGDGARARSGIARARELVGQATRRERQHVEALSALIGGDSARGLALVDEHVAEFPRDAVLVNQASSTIGFGGRADREEYRQAFLERLAPAYGDDWWFLSALAFTYHETGRLDDSRRLSERSLEQYPGNANASHNVAHVHFETVDNDGGVRFLDEWLAGYDRRAPYHCHLAWHLAMFELHRGNHARALDIYEQDIVGGTNPRLAVMDGSALLWRFGLFDCPERPLPWARLAEVAKQVARPGFVFGDIHAALAYAASGDQVALTALVDSLSALDAKGHPFAGAVAIPLVKGAAAFAAGDYTAALAHLEPVDAETHRMGGSHAQWEIFEETRVICHLKLGHHAEAARLLRRRLARRASPRDAHWLTEAESTASAPGGGLETAGHRES